MAPRQNASRSSRPPIPSPQLQMPHVFVIPPEEEQQDNPPWCCFDADEQPENIDDFPSNPDVHFFDIPYPLRPSEHDAPAPVHNHTSHHPRLRAPVPRKLEKKQRPEAITIIETKPSQTRQKYSRDSDVIEVVKVKRTREALTDLEENMRAKRSRTLKARASQALRSIKNVGKGSHRTHVKDLWTSSESMPGIFKGVQEQIYPQQDQKEQCPPVAPFKKGSLARSNSRSLSQIFQPIKPLRSEIPLSAEIPVTVESSHVVPAENILSLKCNDTNTSLVEIPDTPTLENAPNKPGSPSHTTKKKHVTTKFSVRELNRLFSFSPSSDGPSLTRKGATPSASTLPSGYPDVPVEETAFADVRLLDLGTAGRKLASRFHQALRAHPKHDKSRRRRLSELSIEMKLDSLHFDALSFDPEDFDVSMEENVLR